MSGRISERPQTTDIADDDELELRNVSEPALTDAQNQRVRIKQLINKIIQPYLDQLTLGTLTPTNQSDIDAGVGSLIPKTGAADLTASGSPTNLTFLRGDNTWARPESAFTDYIPMVMEVPNDTVAYPDIFTLGDASSKISGFWLPNSAASEIIFKCIVPEDLHGTPVAKVVIYMLPRTTVANSTVNLQIKRLYVATTADVDAAFTSETAVNVELTSTADFLTIYEYDVTAEPSAGNLFHGILKRDPAAANDDFTEDLFIVGMVLKIERTTT